MVACLVVAPATAAAQGFGIRVTPEGLDEVLPVAEGFLPDAFPVPGFELTLLGCPGEDMVATVPDLEVQFTDWQSFDVKMEDGGLVVDAVLDLEISTPLTINKVYACVGEANCDLFARAESVEVQLTVGVGSGPEGGIELSGVTVELGLTPEDFELTSEGCLAGDVAEWLIETFEGTVIDYVRPIGEEALADKVSVILDGLLKDLLALQIEQFGFGLSATVDSVEVSRSVGLTVVGDVGVTWAGDTVYAGAAPEVSAPEGEPLPVEFGPGQFHVAASDQLVTLALYEAWRGGMINDLIAGLAPQSIELESDGIVQQLGLPAGTAIELAVEVTKPLVAAFGRSDADARVDLEGLEVRLAVSSPGAETRQIRIETEGSMDAGLKVDPALGGLVLDTKNLAIDQLTIETESDTLELDQARVREMMDSLVMPLLGHRLSSIPVAPALNNIAGYFAYVRTLESEGGWQRIGVDFVPPTPDDRTSPDTEIVGRTNLVRAGANVFRARGEDDVTPTPLLRYNAWLNGELLTETPTGLTDIRFTVEDGEHVLRVAAVDLNGNEDRVPDELAFTADGVPPVLEILEAPDTLHFDREASVRWTVTDERGEWVQSSWELYQILPDGRTELVEKQDFTAGVFSLQVETLTPDTLYEVLVIGRDEAGNLTSETVGFAVDPGATSGCSAGGPMGAPLASFAALFVLLGVRRLRRRS